MISVEHLDKYYGSFRALDDVSFQVEKGEIVGLLGPNGAGKTTIMRILAGYMPPSGGEARVAGYDVFEESLEVRRRIGYLPESVPLYGEMTVRAYLDYMASLRRVPDRKAAIWQAMGACHIADRADSLIAKLSKGLRQRVGLAQAILHDPEVLILDEPTIGLDPKQIIEVRELIRDLGQEHTVILSTHILPEVSQTCNRVLIIHKGQIVAEGTPAELTAMVQGGGRVHMRVARKETDDGGAASGAEICATLSGVGDVIEVHPLGEDGYEVLCTANVDRRPDLARAIVERGWDLMELRAVGMSLEDIFLRLTTEDEPEVD